MREASHRYAACAADWQSSWPRQATKQVEPCFKSVCHLHVCHLHVWYWRTAKRNGGMETELDNNQSSYKIGRNPCVYVLSPMTMGVAASSDRCCRVIGGVTAGR